MIKTEIVNGELPYRINIDNLRGAGKSPSSAAMAALSAGGKIPAGMRDSKAAAMYLFWNYEANSNWEKLIHILEKNEF